MAAGDPPDFLDGLDELSDAPLFALPDWPDGDDPPAAWPEPSEPAVTPPPVAELLPPSTFAEPALPAVTPPPARAVVLQAPIEPPAADEHLASGLVVYPTVEEADGVFVCWAEFASAAGQRYADVRVALPLPDLAGKVTSNRLVRVDGGQLVWDLGTIPAGGAVDLRVKFPAVASNRRFFATRPAFEMTYTPVPVPVLKCEARGPLALPVGERGVVALTVSNAGELSTGPIRVRMTDPTAAVVVAEVGLDSLAAGGGTELHLPVTLDSPGTAEWVFNVTAGDTTAATTFRTEGVVPALEAALTHDRTVLADAETDITLTVSNPSPSAARAVVAWVELPDEVRAVGRPQAVTRIEWPLSDLPAGESRSVTVRVRGYAPGLAWLRGGGSADGGVTTRTSGNMWCEVDPRAGGTALDAVLSAMQAETPDDWARPAAEASGGERYVLFDLAGTRFAAPIGQVREVIRPPAVTPVPGTPNWLVGLANVRGDVVSVVDLPRFLGLDDRTDPDRRGLLLAQSAAGGLTVGFLVDDVASIRRLPADGPAIPAGVEADRVAPYLSGVSEHLHRLVPRLDLERLLLADDLHAVTA